MQTFVAVLLLRSFRLERDWFPTVQSNPSPVNLKGKDVFEGSVFIPTVLFILLIHLIANFIICRHVTHQGVMLSVDSSMMVAITCN